LKNKHLVLLFVAVLALGGLGRYCRWGQGTYLDTALFKKPLNELSQVQICGKDTTNIHHASGQWTISRRGETAVAPDSVVQAVLDYLAGIRTTQLLHTDRPDTLGLGLGHQRSIVCTSKAWPPEVFHIGRTLRIDNQAFTWIGLPLHEQYYLCRGDLNAIFGLGDTHLFPVVSMTTDTASLTGIFVQLNGDTLLDARFDTLANVWLKPPFGRKDTLHRTLIGKWKNGWANLGPQTFAADFFDAKGAPETFCGQVLLSFRQVPATVKHKLFFVQHPVLPDDPEKIRYFRHVKPQYLLESELQPGIYFALKDSNLLRNILQTYQ
jgi:hypothetical protein